MNKAFVREPDADARVNCPQCGGLAVEVSASPLNEHICDEHRSRLGDSGWCCRTPACEVVYFDMFEQRVLLAQLRQPLYPKSPSAAVCACFGMTLDDIEADLRDGQPRRIRELYAKSRSAAAQCERLSMDGRCCLPEVQRLYLRGSPPP
ncbi:MAG: hypothetical protein ACKO2P_00200 [Planctomycetota bacterium]